MPPLHSPLKKNIIYFLSLFNTLTLIVTSIFFLILFFLDIPLKYLFPFIITYGVSFVTLVIIDPKNPTFHSFPMTKRFAYSLLLIANITAIIFLFILLNRYQLGQYTFTTFVIALIIINGSFIEYMHQPIKRFIATNAGKWTIRTILLMCFTALGLTACEIISRTTPPPDTSLTPPRKTFSEVTGVISTADPTLFSESTGSEILTGTSAPLIANETVDTDSSRPSGSIEQTNAPNEVTGELSTALATELQKQGIRIDSIESVDGRATADIKDGKITVQVVNPRDIPVDTPPAPTSGTGWYIRSSVKKSGGGGPLQGVVISAPISLLPPGSHRGYQSIILIADGASNIYFTTDGSDPSCDGKGSTEKLVEAKTLTIKAISCYGNDKIRGPIASYSYTRE